MKNIKKYFLVGLATILPLFATVYLVLVIFQFADRLAGTYINVLLFKHYGFKIPGLGVFALLLLFLATGFFASHFIGRKLLLVFESLFQRVPIVARIYPSIKQLSDFLFRGDELRRLKKVVLVPYPCKGSYAMGFITNESLTRLQLPVEGTPVSVFVPLAPSPFSGFILLIPQEQVQPLDISMEDAIKFIVSGGIVFGPENGSAARKS